jgi:hypothetical protein
MQRPRRAKRLRGDGVQRLAPHVVRRVGGRDLARRLPALGREVRLVQRAGERRIRLTQVIAQGAHKGVHHGLAQEGVARPLRERREAPLLGWRRSRFIAVIPGG